jgi:hypothetical protein
LLLTRAAICADRGAAESVKRQSRLAGAVDRDHMLSFAPMIVILGPQQLAR